MARRRHSISRLSSLASAHPSDRWHDGRFLLSPRAQRDLDEIWDYTATRWGVEQAESYIRQLWWDIRAVAARPIIGRECPEIRKEYYRYASGSHILFYRRIPGGIDVVRILHARIDFEQHL